MIFLARSLFSEAKWFPYCCPELYLEVLNCIGFCLNIRTTYQTSVENFQQQTEYKLCKFLFNGCSSDTHHPRPQWLMDIHIDERKMKRNKVLGKKECLTINNRVNSELTGDLKTPRLLVGIRTCGRLLQLAGVQARFELIPVKIDPGRDRSEGGNWVWAVVRTTER